MHHHIDGECQGGSMNSAKNRRFDNGSGIKNARLGHLNHLTSKHIETVTWPSPVNRSENLTGIMARIEQQCTQGRLACVEQDIVSCSFIEILRLI